jgi:hypothetical protein
MYIKKCDQVTGVHGQVWFLQCYLYLEQLAWHIPRGRWHPLHWQRSSLVRGHQVSTTSSNIFSDPICPWTPRINRDDFSAFPPAVEVRVREQFLAPPSLHPGLSSSKLSNCTTSSGSSTPSSSTAQAGTTTAKRLGVEPCSVGRVHAYLQSSLLLQPA